MSLINKYTRNPAGILSCKHIFHFCDLNRLVDVMYSYVTHCADVLIPAKQNTVFPKQQALGYKGFEICSDKKKRVFFYGSATEKKQVNKEVKQLAVRKAKTVQN